MVRRGNPIAKIMSMHVWRAAMCFAPVEGLVYDTSDKHAEGTNTRPAEHNDETAG